MIGQTISHFKIIEKLGEGGMGVVYKARDTKLGRDVALKFLPESLTPTKEDRERFTREAKAAASLSHPNICTIHNIDDHEGTPFMVMEYIEGETLREKISSGGLTPEAALDYGSKIAGALTEAHEHGIIHRDIKPENIMVDAKGRIKVMDFGLAKLKQARNITKTGSTVGTLAYSSPEQIRGEEVDHRSDLFSIGIVLYEMLTGRKPFQGEHQAAMTYSIVNEKPTPIKTYLPGSPEEFTQIFKKLLAKDLGNRIESASQVTAILEKVKKSADTLSRQTPPAAIESEVTEKDSGSGSTTYSITVPDFRGKTLGKAVIFTVTAVLLVLISFVGWWFVGGNTPENQVKAAEEGIIDRSIAVLPFTNLSGTDDIKPITKGLHVDLLTRLSNIADLQIKSRNSVTDFRGTDLSLPVIADSLGARWIVEGGIQEAGGQIQVSAQLIDPQGDIHVWADNYRRKLTAENLFAIQEDIAGEIANALQAELTTGEKERVMGAPTENLGAYRLYVQGRRELAHRRFGDDKHIVQAAELFQSAIEQDSSFALAWAGLADALGGELPDSLSLPNVTQKEAALRALELDPDLAEAHAAMGNVHLLEMDGRAAVQQLRRALELKPSYWEAHHLLGVFHLITGRVKEALDHLEIAVELNPRHAMARHGLYDAYLASGQANKSLEEARKQRRLGLEETSAVGGEIRALFGLRQLDEARRIAEKQISKPDVAPVWKGWFRAYLVSINSAAGDTALARKYLAQLQEQEDPAKLAQAYASLGKTDLALEAYQRLSDNDWGRFGPSIEFRYGIMYELEPLRQDTRYEELIQKANQAWNLNPDGSIPKENITM
jgi:serine/threonine protein kinase/tetratricopeptide (TPR) repeat protein